MNVFIENFLIYLRKLTINQSCDPFKIEDIFNKDKTYNKDNFFELKTEKRIMYEKFSNTIKTPGNNNENSNNLTNFKHNIKKSRLMDS